MQKNKIIAALAFPVAVLLVWTLLLTAKVLAMPEATVRIAGYDPRDLLSGHYIDYTIDWDNTDCAQFENNTCPQEDFARYADNAYWGSRYRFYIPETHAQELDELFRFNDENHVFEIIYKYSPGMRPVAKELLIDGRPWRETINNNRGKNESNQS